MFDSFSVLTVTSFKILYLPTTRLLAKNENGLTPKTCREQDFKPHSVSLGWTCGKKFMVWIIVCSMSLMASLMNDEISVRCRASRSVKQSSLNYIFLKKDYPSSLGSSWTITSAGFPHISGDFMMAILRTRATMIHDLFCQNGVTCPSIRTHPWISSPG